jgi:hypothetical protein
MPSVSNTINYSVDGDMSDSESNGRRTIDTLTVPAVLVLPGDPEPSEFRSRYPDAVRLPVRVVSQAGASAADAVPRQPAPARRAAPPRSGNGPSKSEHPGVQQPDEDAAPDVAAAAPAAGAAHPRTDPVETFLRVKSALDRLD